MQKYVYKNYELEKLKKHNLLNYIFQKFNGEPKVLSSLKKNGFVQIKKTLNLNELSTLALKAETILKKFKKFKTQEEVPFNVPYSVNQNMCNMTLLEYPSKKLNYPALKIIRNSPVWKIITNYFKSNKLLCLVPISSFRSISPDEKKYSLPYHQDGFALPQLPSFDMLSAWILLKPDICDNKVPGLEFLKERMRENLEIDRSKKGFLKWSSIKTNNINDLKKKSGFWRPTITLGDILLFNRYCIHKSYLCNLNKKTRYSLELRFLKNNSATRELFKKRKNPVILIGHQVFAPQNIKWKEGSWNLENLNW